MKDLEACRLADQAFAGQWELAQQSPQVGGETGGAQTARLLVAGEDQHQGAFESRCIQLARDHRALGEEGLHVGHAAAVDPLAVGGEHQRVPGPAGLIGVRDHVHVPRQDEPALDRRARPRHQARLVDAERVLALETDLPTCAVQEVGEVLRAGDVGGGGDRVEGHQAAADLEQLGVVDRHRSSATVSR